MGDSRKSFAMSVRIMCIMGYGADAVSGAGIK